MLGSSKLPPALYEGERSLTRSPRVMGSCYLEVLSVTEDGVIVVATANDPTSLGAALSKRPGRFDRVALFAAPTPELRQDYLGRLSAGGSMHRRRLRQRRRWNASRSPRFGRHTSWLANLRKAGRGTWRLGVRVSPRRGGRRSPVDSEQPRPLYSLPVCDRCRLKSLYTFLSLAFYPRPVTTSPGAAPRILKEETREAP
jgi:hypothetical protein